MKMFTLIFALLSSSAFAQNTHVQQLFYNGSDLQYICDASANGPETSVSVSGGTLTNIVVSTNVGTVTTAAAHNLWIGARVRISGSATTALNGTYTIATVPSTTTYTIATSGVSDATYTTGLIIRTNSPLYVSPVWFVTVMHYTNSVLDQVTPGGGSLSINYTAKCSDRALY